MPFKIQYRYRPAEYGDQLVRMYLLTNDKESKLGTTPLPDGMVRVFRQNGRDGLSFLVAQPVKYIPIGDKIELNLGRDPNVIFELVKLRFRRDNIWLQLHGADIFKKVGEATAEIEVNSSVVGWDDQTLYSQRGATTPASRSTWKFADLSPVTWFSAAIWQPRSSITRPSSTSPP